MVMGTLRALCSQGDVQTLGMPAGAIMSVVGAYGGSAELAARPAADPCLLGPGALACLDTKYWLPKLIQERSQQSNITNLEYFNWALRQEGAEGGVLYVEDLERGTRVLLAGYKDLSPEQIETLVQAANVINAGLSQASFPRIGSPGQSCTEQQPTPAQLIDEAFKFLVGLTLTETIRMWSDAARAIGTNNVLPQVGQFSGQDWFNYQVALFVLSVKESLNNRVINSYQANRILGPKLQYVLEQIRSSATNFSSNPAYHRAKVQAWLDKIVVAARTHSIHDPDNKWFLLDFLRVIDTKGNELAWTTNIPSGTIIDVVVFRQDFAGHSNGTLLAFLKVDSSRPDRGSFNDPLRDSNLIPNDPNNKAKEMLDWLNAVYNHIAQNAVPGAAFYWHGMKIVGWIFTNPQNPAMMQQLITAIHSQKNSQFSYPFFIAYVADGQPEVVCFGCRNQNDVLAVWMTACQMGGICAPNVRVVGGGGQGLTDNMLFPTPGDPNETGAISPSTGSLFFDMADGGGGGDEPPSSCGQD